MKTVAISQPTFLPWLGYFNLIADADVFVLLDTVQFERRCWQSRNRVRDPGGQVQWLTAPVSKQPQDTPIRDILIAPDPPDWRRKMVRTIETRLRRAPYFDEAEALYQTILGEDAHFEKLADMNIRFIESVARAFDLQTHLFRCSDLPVTGGRAGLLLDICQHFGAATYYSSAGSSVYLEESRPLFEAAGVEIAYQNWAHPEYAQAGPGFVSHLSCIDAIACMGITAAAAAVKTRPIPNSRAVD